MLVALAASFVVGRWVRTEYYDWKRIFVEKLELIDEAVTDVKTAAGAVTGLATESRDFLRSTVTKRINELESKQKSQEETIKNLSASAGSIESENEK